MNLNSTIAIANYGADDVGAMGEFTKEGSLYNPARTVWTFPTNGNLIEAYAISGIVALTAVRALISGDISFQTGDPMVYVTDDGLIIKTPLTVINNSTFDLTNFALKMELKNSTNYLIAGNTSKVGTIRHKGQAVTSLEFFFNVTRLLEDGCTWILFNDTDLINVFEVSLTYASLFGLTFNMSIPSEWGAPLNNFTIGSPSVGVVDTSVQVSIPISYSNHSPMSLGGSLRVEVVDKGGNVLKDGSLDISTDPGQTLDETLSIPIGPADIPNLGFVRVYVETDLFSYGPLVYEI